jgi:hypothetical protein
MPLLKQPLHLLAVALVAVAPGIALAQTYSGGGGGGGGGHNQADGTIDQRANRVTVSIRTVPVGQFCLRAVAAVGYDPRLNQRLYSVQFDSGPMTSLGAVAYENAFSSARTQADAMMALANARRDAEPYGRSAGAC